VLNQGAGKVRLACGPVLGASQIGQLCRQRIDLALQGFVAGLEALIYRPEAVAADLLDFLEQILAKLRLSDLASDVVENFVCVCARLAIDPARPWPDVAGAVDQAAPEVPEHTGSHPAVQVAGGRVSLPAQVLWVLSAERRRHLQLGVGSVLRASREAPLQTNAKDLRLSAQERQRRRWRGLARYVGQHRCGRDRSHIHRVHGAHAGQILAGIHASHINRELASARHLYPVTRAPAPFHVIRDGAGCSVPADGHGGDRNALVHSRVAADQHSRWRILHARRQHTDWSVIDHGAVVDGVELARLVLDQFQLKPRPFRPGHVPDVELH